LPRPGHVHIEVLPVVPCDGATPTQLRDLSRARILLALDEPDLINSDGVAALAMEKADDKR
jgi:hypothetical protein